MGESEQPVVVGTARIDWRKLLLLSLLIMVLPTITAILLDKWLGFFPIITIAAIVICFPTATFLVIRSAMEEMDRVIAEVAPAPTPLSEEVQVSGEAQTGNAAVSPEQHAEAENAPAS